MRQLFCRILSGVLCLGVAGAQELPAFDKKLAAAGKELYRTHCATCHGPHGRGDGATATHLHFVPPDLTRLGQRSRNGFSFDQVRRMIDGRNPIKGHGGPEMPVWGDAFKAHEGSYSEREVGKKVTSLVNYLASIQQR